MTRFATIALALSLALSTAAQTKTKCSYFMPFNWQFSYPQTFAAHIDPGAHLLTVEPTSPVFAGIISISVHNVLNCGNTPLCSFLFQPVVSQQSALPAAFFECSANSHPFFIRVCWLEKWGEEH